MKIVNTDAYTIQMHDLSWDGLESLGELISYDRTEQEKMAEVIGDADAVFTSKNEITAEIMDACPNLKFIGTTATGYDNIDIIAAKERNIAVCNIPAYSTDSVAQHTFALILEVTNNVGLYNLSVSKGNWSSSIDFTFSEKPLIQLSGRSLGIIGYGSIGKRVGEIAKAFGMTVNVYSKDPEATVKSDILTLHCPATDKNRGFINKDFINSMKDGAILINTARGSLVNEKDLADALKSGKLAAAALDVISCEPPKSDHLLLQNVPNLYITPHVAWSSFEARKIICETSAANLMSFIEGGRLNRIV